MDIKKIRDDFPILKRTDKGKQLVYLDNAATSQKPQVVINSITDFYEKHNANIHRGAHKLSREASEMYERAHDKVAKFFGVKGREEIIFTRNTTESINLVAQTLNLKEGDEIITTEMEHHSNLVPWMMLKKRIGIRIKYVPVDEEGEIKAADFEKLITPKTKVITCNHVSNFLGTINPVKEIGKIAAKHKIIFIVDGAQSAPHMPVNVKDIGCDFFACSSHKMCGPTGIGVLYGKRELLEKMEPYMGGGGMIHEVSFDEFTTHTLPWKFEAGTPNIADGYAFGTAVDYLSRTGMKNIWNHEQELTKHALEQLSKIKGIKIYGPKDWRKRAGVIAFNIDGINPHDVATLLDEKYNIAVRSGHHCVMPLHVKFGQIGSVRASFYLYNTKEEVDLMIKGLNEIVQVFG
jgi:cysteine desulfurase/selenocysteine lyase